MIWCIMARNAIIPLTSPPAGHTGGLVQLRILQQWAAMPPILAAGDRRRPTAASAASRRRPQNLKTKGEGVGGVGNP